MFIDIKGKSVKTPRFLIKEAAIFYGEYLLGKKLAEKVSLTIEFDKHEDMDNDYAYCDYIDENPKWFVITINRTLSKKDTLMALAHEMVHVKQYAKGELKDLSRPARMTKWMGEKFIPEEMDYWEQPWEVEAYGRERGLYLKFMAKMKDNDSI